MWDGEKLIKIPILDRVFIYNALIMQINVSDVYIPMLVDLSSFTVEMQSISDSVVDENITVNHIEISDVYTPPMIDLSGFSVTLEELTEDIIIDFPNSLQELENREDV